MVDDQVFDYFSDGDLADAENLPVGPRYIGYVSKVDTSQSAPGSFRKYDKPVKDGRTEIPEIAVDVTAVGIVGEGKFSDDTNYYKVSTLNFRIGTPDRIGRHSLARLVEYASGMTKEELLTTPIREAVKRLDKVYVTFDVRHREYTTRAGEKGCCVMTDNSAVVAIVSVIAIVISLIVFSILHYNILLMVCKAATR
jgi:hypothetical protein